MTDNEKIIELLTEIRDSLKKPEPKKPSKDFEKQNISEAAINIIDYLNEKTGKGFKPVDANKNFIKARIKEGHTVENIKAVIDMKCVEWLNDAQNNKYLRPATLFNATKFNQYVGELGSAVAAKPGDEYNHYRKIGQGLGINPTSTESDRDYISRVKDAQN